MINTTAARGSGRAAARIVRTAAAVLALFALAGAGLPALAASSCPLGFRSGSAPTIDGNRSGTEWGDASITASGSPCLGRLLDVGGTFGNVTVYSKRYTRGGAAYLGLFLEV
ncbi:MAG TPA: hypothetical protein VES39_05800, partial [Rhodospirillales bacterium]|nr:hypothetical protein [Rhodospirillales bacterium]